MLVCFEAAVQMSEDVSIWRYQVMQCNYTNRCFKKFCAGDGSVVEGGDPIVQIFRMIVLGVNSTTVL